MYEHRGVGGGQDMGSMFCIWSRNFHNCDKVITLKNCQKTCIVWRCAKQTKLNVKRRCSCMSMMLDSVWPQTEEMQFKPQSQGVTVPGEHPLASNYNTNKNSCKLMRLTAFNFFESIYLIVKVSKKLQTFVKVCNHGKKYFRFYLLVVGTLEKNAFVKYIFCKRDKL